MSGTVHRYATALDWSGSTGAGYEHYPRSHRVTAVDGGAAAVAAQGGLLLSSDAAFFGDPALLNPEVLLVAAASSCQLLSFLAVTARARIDVVRYTDEAVGEMPEDDPPMRLVRMRLRPHVTVRPDRQDPERTSDERLRHWVEVGHRQCFIANSLATEIAFDPTFERT